MRILFVIPTLNGGGAERAMSNITTHLPTSVNADILVNSVSKNDYPTEANIISLGMKPVRDKRLGYQIIAAIKRTARLKRLKRKNKYDACISFIDSANICNILSGNKYCKVIISVRTTLSRDPSFAYRKIIVPIAKILYNNADKVVAASRGIRDDLIDNLKLDAEKVCTITNGFDTERIREACKQNINYNKIPKHFTYISVGSYTYPKGHWHLIRAFKKVREKCDDVHLIILGEGNLEEYLREIIRVNYLEDCVTLMPFSNNPFAIMSMCDVYVMPSLLEGYSNSLCEAVICGLPCVATDFRSSAREILAPDTDHRYEIKEGVEYAKYGILTPVCSGVRYQGTEELEAAEDYLAEAMIGLYTDKQVFCEFEPEFFDIKSKVMQYMELVM